MASLISAVVRAARPNFRSREDRVAFAVHALVMGKGFHLVAVGSQADSVAASESPESIPHEEQGIDGWQDMEAGYAFLYRAEDTARPVLVKCLSAAGKLLVHASNLGAKDDPVLLELVISQFTNDSEDRLKGYTDLDGLAALVESSLEPIFNTEAKQTKSGQPAQKLDYTAASSQRQGRSEAHNRPNPLLADDPLRADPLRVDGVGRVRPPLGFGFGDDDLLPSGPGMMMGGRGGMHHDPFMSGGGGGMHMGPGDPMFAGGGLRHPGMGMNPMEVPPGARYDPIGPPGMPGFNPRDFQRGARGGPNIHPDIGPPPGMGGDDMDNMFG